MKHIYVLKWDINDYLIFRQLNSKMHVFTTSIEQTKIQTGMSLIDQYIWTGFSDELHENIFMSPYGLNMNTTSLSWKWGEPNGKKIENCVIFLQFNSTLVADYPCELEGNIACDIENERLFYIHNIEKIFPRYAEMEFILDAENIETNSNISIMNLEFRGFGGSKISKETKHAPWSLVSDEGHTLLTIWSMGLPIGNKLWNDCFGGKVEVVLNACGKEEFGCGDGTCLPMGNRCNEQIDCPVGMTCYKYERKLT